MTTSRCRGFAAAPIAVIVLVALAMLGPASAGAAFPGADGPIAFTSDRDTAAGEIYSIIPGGDALRLTDSNSSSDPAISPDGSKIAYISADPGGSYQVFVMNADGTGRTPVTSTPTAKQDPTWSPDGTRIAFVANSFDVDGQTDLEIWVINADGSGRQNLTINSFSDTQPAWSPDGSKIAFVSNRTGDTNRNVYVMNANGSGPVSITPNEELPCDGLCYQGHDDSPAWSPDGSRIAYVHNQTENAGGPPNIWTMAPDGGGKINVSNSATSFIEPAWSPQGTRLAAVGTAPSSTDRNIYVMGANGSGQAPIDTATSHERDPDWGVPAPEPPPNDIAFGGVKRNKKKGTAKLTVEVPGVGDVALGGKNIKPQSKDAASAGQVKVTVKATGKAKKKLKKKGKAKVKPAVTFTPVGGTPNTETTKVKLVKK